MRYVPGIYTTPMEGQYSHMFRVHALALEGSSEVGAGLSLISVTAVLVYPAAERRVEDVGQYECEVAADMFFGSRAVEGSRRR